MQQRCVDPLPFARLFEPAVDYARNGFAVSPTIAVLWQSSASQFAEQPGFAEHFLAGGRAPQAGELVTNPALARSLELIAETRGEAFYRGALKLNLRTFFAWTGVFLIVVAAGVLAYGIHDLQEAGILPGLNNLAFDVSATIPPSSVIGTVLKGIFNFSPATTWLEAIAWVAYIVPVMFLFVRQVWFSAPPPARTDAPGKVSTTA